MYYMLQNIIIISSMLHGYGYLQFLILTIFYLNIYIKCNLFRWCKAEFSASLLRSLVSHDNPSEITLLCWFASQKTCIIIIILNENICAA